MWAQMIRLGKHESTDDPPDKPFWRGRKCQQDVSYLSPSPKRASISPSKKVSVRSELLDQLTKWHNLSECGVVSHEEYEELRKKILGDIKHNYVIIENLKHKTVTLFILIRNNNYVILSVYYNYYSSYI